MLSGFATRLLWPLLACLSIAGCATAGGEQTHAARGSPVARWTARHRVAGVVDLSSPSPDGSIFVAAAGRLDRLSTDGTLRRFADAYSAPPGLEPYIALSPGQRVAGAGCRFPAGNLFALRLEHGTGVTVIDPRGRVAEFAALPHRGLENGIAFDTTGRFGHRLLVTATAAGTTTVFAIDCRGHVQVLTRTAPRVEGGLAVAPAGFGRFGGDLIAPDEVGGLLYAIERDGRSMLLAHSGVAHGQDIGVESEGFVPSRFGDALVSDRLTPRNRHPGDNLILGISRASLEAHGVAAGDLLVASEGGATTIDVTCRQTCRARLVAVGPTRAHIEGHIVFTLPR